MGGYFLTDGDRLDDAKRNVPAGAEELAVVVTVVLCQKKPRLVSISTGGSYWNIEASGSESESGCG